MIHGLLRGDLVDVEGRFHTVHGGLVARGPRSDGPPLVIGARGPKMMRLAARFGDAWNTWSPDPQTIESFRPLVEELERACEDVGRDSIGRSIDVAVDPYLLLGEEPTWISEYLIAGSASEIAAGLLAFQELGIEEVRCMVWPDRPAHDRPRIIELMADVVTIVHGG